MKKSKEKVIKIVNNSYYKIRLDKLLFTMITETHNMSRTQIQKLIHDGALKNAKKIAITDSSYKPAKEETFFLTLPTVKPYSLKGKKKKLNIVFEDENLIVINKEPGVVVHPAPGNYEDTLVHYLIYHTKNTLSGIGGVLRPGIVHRLDKETSGLIVVAKDDISHQSLSKQFENHKIKRNYKALIWGKPEITSKRNMLLEGISKEEDVFKIQKNIRRHSHDRKKMSVSDAGKYACTRFKIEEVMGNQGKPAVCLVDCWLETGRTHQIRVHLNFIGNSIVGDKIYGKKSSFSYNNENFKILSISPRHSLHAYSLGFIHPHQNKYLFFEIDIPEDMKKTIDFFRNL